MGGGGGGGARANECVVRANGTAPRKAVQGDYPGSMLFFAAGSAIKRITAGVKARRDRSLLKFRSAGRAFTLRHSHFERRKNTAFRRGTRALTQDIGRYKGQSRDLGHQFPKFLLRPIRTRQLNFRADERRTGISAF